MPFLKRSTDFETRIIKSGVRHGEGEQEVSVPSYGKQTMLNYTRTLYQNCPLFLRWYSTDLNVSFCRRSQLS
jgi:hypothetical protein